MKQPVVEFLALYLFYLGLYITLGLAGIYLCMFFVLSYLLPVLYIRYH